MDEGFPRSSSSREEDDLHVAETAPHVITEDAVVSLSPEFAVLSERFGELTDGKGYRDKFTGFIRDSTA